MSSRREFLARVRAAVAHDHSAPELPARLVRAELSQADRVLLFTERFKAAGGQLHRVKTPDEASKKVVQLLAESSAKKLLVGESPILSSMHLREQLAEAQFEIHLQETSCNLAQKSACFAADAGVTGVEYLLAESGSMVLASRLGQPRSYSLLPPLHIAVAHEGQLLDDIAVFFERETTASDLPACWTVITGPSKTGDIELKLVTGVHGPGEVHLVLVEVWPSTEAPNSDNAQ